MTAPSPVAPSPATKPRKRARATGPTGLTKSAGVGLGIAVLWFSIIALIPLIAVVVEASGAGWGGFLSTLTDPQTAAALRLTITQAAIITVVNVVLGTALAWVLVRDQFWGKRIIEVLVDLPFALPTIVAGLVLLALYGNNGPLGIDVTNTPSAVLLALAFVTLPFVVRTVQPVLAELDRDVEQAAASLGANRITILRRIILPALTPAIFAGAALSFARGVSEFGALILLSGNLPMRTEVASVRILGYIESGDQTSAAAVATVLLAVSLAVIVALDVVQRRVANRG